MNRLIPAPTSVLVLLYGGREIFGMAAKEVHNFNGWTTCPAKRARRPGEGPREGGATHG